MTAYEFTKIGMDFTGKVKPRCYDASVVAFQIEYGHGANDPREEKEYHEAENIYLDLTMSCTREEAVSWMKYWMVNAIAYGIVTKSRDWQYKFLAAYDLWNEELQPGPKALSTEQARFLQHC